MTNPLPPIAEGPGAPTTAAQPKDKRADRSLVLKNNKDRPKPPSPPLKIRDGNTHTTYTRMGLLGEGGFARVYEVVSPVGKRLAAKVVYKNRLDDQKKKTRLYAEIKIHRMMVHPHIVRFLECFEDEENVYMILELCSHGSMVELLRRRRYFTEPEARFYLLQIIAACQYMHKSRVMHRDLKLGNLFLDQNMNVKLGDFGLAALIENEGDRRKTVCGTPNYIAPEVLYGKSAGHSYEADVWSVGVTMYTMLVGRPPFQTKEVKNIYKRIKDLNYSFPEEAAVPEAAKDLITRILTHDPNARPTLEQILAHEWFQGTFPPFIPTSALDTLPDFGIISAAQSRANFEKAKERSAIGRNLPIAVPAPSPGKVKSMGQARQAVAPAVAEQERDFKKAVQPDSPISELLSSARKPLVVAPQPMASRDPPLMRRFVPNGGGSTGSPLRREIASKKDTGKGKGLARLGEDEEDEIEEVEEEPHQPAARDRAPVYRAASQSRPAASPLRDRPVLSAAGRKINARSPIRQASRSNPQDHAKKVSRPRADPLEGLTEGHASLYDRMACNIEEALEAKAKGVPWHPEEIRYQPSHPRYFIAAWLDYCNKYGMGYAMTDGSVGVNFNDSSMLVLAPNKNTFDCIEPEIKSDGAVEYIRRSHDVEEYPDSLANRVYLINHFSDYLNRKLNAQHSFTFEDLDIRSGMVFATKYLRTKHVIMFRLSNDLMQLNFVDHTKLLISGEARVISFIDKDYELYTWSLASLTQTPTTGMSKSDRKRIEQVLYKVQYARDLLSRVEQYMKAGPRKQRASKHAGMNGTAAFDHGVGKVEVGM